MTVGADAVRTLTDWTAPDSAQDQLRRSYLAHLAAHEDAMWRECTAGHITASALVLDAGLRRALLTLHPKVGRLLQLGGH